MNTKFKKFVTALLILFLFNCASRNSLKVSAPEAEYLQLAVRILQNYREIITQIKNPIIEVSENYSLLMDKNLRLKISIYLKALQSNGKNLREITDVPVRCLDIHKDLLETAQYLDRFADFIAQAFEETDVINFSQAINNLTYAPAPIQRAVKRINELK